MSNYYCQRSKLLYDWRSVSMSWYRAHLWPDITSCWNCAVWNLWSCFYGAPSLTRGRVWNLQCNHSMVSRSEPVTILYCLIRDSPNLNGQVPVFISPMNRVAQLYPGALRFPLCCLLHDSQGYGGGILALPQPGGPCPGIYILQEQNGPVQSQSHVTNKASQSVFLGA
jgi:hypothetical protein